MTLSHLLVRIKKLLWAILGIAALLLSAWLVIRVAHDEPRYSAVAEGQVVRLWTRHRPGTRGNNLYVEYQFTAASAQGTKTIRQESQVHSFSFYTRLKVGGPITLRYVPAEPEGARIDQDFDPMDFSNKVLLPLVLMFAGGWCLLSAWWGH